MGIMRVELDKKIENLPLFKTRLQFDISFHDIVNYGIYNIDIPLSIKETDFEYFQKLIPAYETILDYNLIVNERQIVNNATGEMKAKVSEYIGVGTGLKFFIDLLGIELSSISKIPKPDDQRKYLDFISKSNKGLFELECKGTINESSKNRLLNDIREKKKDSSSKNIKIGTITFARNYSDTSDSYIYVTDDFYDNYEGYKIKIKDLYNHYSLFLSFIMDSTYYNRAYKYFIMNEKSKEEKIPKNKFFTSINFHGIKYLGECYDRRLAFQPNEIKLTKKDTIETIFERLTVKKGRYKYFIGIDERVIDCLNTKDVQSFKSIHYEGDNMEIRHEENGDFAYTYQDGIIFIRQSNNNLSFLDDIFTENEVQERLRLYVNYLLNEPHECGAPCRSWEKEGKPCEILTFRDHCHFHR